MAKKPQIRDEDLEYFAEINRALYDNFTRAMARLQRAGIDCYRLAHKTSLRLIRPAGMSWRRFLKIIKSVLQPKIGGAYLFSPTTGNVFICDNMGNRPGVFVKQNFC